MSERFVPHLLRRLDSRIARFTIVGVIGVPINVGLLWLFHGVLHLPLQPAWVCAFIPSALANFLGNQCFTYRDQITMSRREWLHRAAKGQATSLFTQIFNIGTLAALTHLQVHYLVADVAAILAASMVNFVLSRVIVYRPHMVPVSSARVDLRRAS